MTRNLLLDLLPLVREKSGSEDSVATRLYTMKFALAILAHPDCRILFAVYIPYQVLRCFFSLVLINILFNYPLQRPSYKPNLIHSTIPFPLFSCSQTCPTAGIFPRRPRLLRWHLLTADQPMQVSPKSHSPPLISCSLLQAKAFQTQASTEACLPTSYLPSSPSTS